MELTRDHSFAISLLHDDEESEARFNDAMSDTVFESSSFQKDTKSKLETAMFTTWVNNRINCEVSFAC